MPIRVVFLSFYFEAWDSLAPIYRLMVEDERFDPIVVSIPRRLTGDTDFHDEQLVSDFYDSVNVPHLRFDFADSAEGTRALEELKPDYVFINYPWQRNYQPGFRVEVLSRFTKVCYVPYYSLPLVNEPGTSGVAPHLYRQRSHQLAAMVFTQDAAVRDAYASTQRGNAHVHLTGSPKLDSLVELANSGAGHWPIPRPSGIGVGANRSRQFRLMWAPHHSYSEAWLNFGVFAEMHRPMLEFARSHPQVDVVCRPHPFLFGTLVDRDVLSQAELDAWLAAWNALPNTAIDSGGEYATMFKACDLLVTDGISFLGEYPLATGKPAIFVEKPGHWQFSPLGELAAAANLRVLGFEGFAEVFDQIIAHGMPDHSEAVAELAASARPFPGKAAERIVELVAQDHAAGTPLVDASSVTELAWENEPGREPLVD